MRPEVVRVRERCLECKSAVGLRERSRPTVCTPRFRARSRIPHCSAFAQCAIRTKRAIPVAKNEILRQAKTIGETNNGWQTLTLDRRIRETNYLQRAARAVDHLTDAPGDELFAAECRSDECGNPLTGLHRHVLRFEKGRMPPTDSFWSVSVYERPGSYLIDKVLEIQPGSGSQRLRYGDDGSLEISIQNTEPEPASCNWLRSPPSRFSIVFRGYDPREEIVSGRYRLPVVRSMTN